MPTYALKIKQWLQIIQKHYLGIIPTNTLSGYTGVTGRKCTSSYPV